MPRRTRQLELVIPTWGGKRRGAGRTPRAGKAGVAHRPRPAVTAATPVHITLRVRRDVPRLRRRHCFVALARAFQRGRDRFGFRLAHYSVQQDHLHLICEADDGRALARGMHALAVRIARQLNRSLERRGPVFADRYHARPLRTPLEVRNGLRYVLQNARKHGIWPQGADPYSSAHYFDGWAEGPVVWAKWPYGPLVVEPTCWLLRVGWRRRHRPLSLAGGPAAPGKAREVFAGEG